MNALNRGKGPMIRINIAWMLDVAKKLDELDTL
jgi:hypothetical protein